MYIDAVIVRARSLIGDAAYRRVLDLSVDGILRDIREDLSEFGVTFDCWFSERSLSDNGAIDRSIAALDRAGKSYMKDGALWFKSTDLGDEKDRVITRDNGIKTYFASDIAYVFNKLERGFEHLALHPGVPTITATSPGMRAGLMALGGSPESPSRCGWSNSFRCIRAGEKAQMSTRSGEFVTLAGPAQAR